MSGCAAEDLHGRPAIGIPGRAAAELRAGSPSGPPGRGDIALAEASGTGWVLRGASGRGVMHKFQGHPRQDCFGVTELDAGALGIVVADGVGAFPRSHEAAECAVSVICQAMVDGCTPAQGVERLNLTLTGMAGDGTGDLATTVTVAVVSPTPEGGLHTDIFWIGDSTPWSLVDGEWCLLTSPEQPEEDGEAYTSTRTQALPTAEPTLRQVSTGIPAGGAFFVMSDGVGTPLTRIAEVRKVLASWWENAPDIFSFASQVEFARKGHMDDRTVVGVWTQPLHALEHLRTSADGSRQHGLVSDL